MDIINILNTIRDNASEQYQTRVPEATKTNILEIQNIMTDPNNAVVVNQFMSSMLNMILKPVLHTKSFENPLKPLKKGRKPLGDTIEEIYANYIQAKGYDPEGKDLLKRHMPDVKTAFHRMNRQDKYIVSVSPQQIAKAFLSYENLENFVNILIGTLKNSNELDEFILMKQIIKDAMDKNALKVCTIKDPLDSEVNAKAFIKTIKTVSGDMTFPSDRNNAWLEAQNTDDKAIITHSNLSEQVLIIDNATNVTVNVDVLASAFNMSVADFNNTRKFVIDAFPDPGIRAILCDELFFQVYEDLLMFKKAENADGLFDNYFLHSWETISYSPLVNAMAFKVGNDEDSDGNIENFDVTYSLKNGVTSTNKRVTVIEGSSYTTTLKGIENGDTVIITMGSNNITNTVYDSETGKVTIGKVIDDISITVS